MNRLGHKRFTPIPAFVVRDRNLARTSVDRRCRRAALFHWRDARSNLARLHLVHAEKIRVVMVGASSGVGAAALLLVAVAVGAKGGFPAAGFLRQCGRFGCFALVGDMSGEGREGGHAANYYADCVLRDSDQWLVGMMMRSWGFGSYAKRTTFIKIMVRFGSLAWITCHMRRAILAATAL